MRPHFSIIEHPKIEPLSYQQAADHLRVDSEDDMVYIESLISVAREHVEGVTGRVGSTSKFLLVAGSWQSLMRDSRDYLLRIGRSPVQSVASVKYYAPGASSLTTMSASDYRLMASAEPASIQKIGNDWPALDDRPDAVQIEFTAGHTPDNPSPSGYLHAMKMLVAHLYEERKPVAFTSCSEIPYSLQFLIEQQRIEGRFA
jgi:uncharacterized phiE125 gp8 family phage protein